MKFLPIALEYYWMVVVIIASIPLLTGTVVYWIAMRPSVIAGFRPGDLAASYLGAIALPFALFLAFMISDIWARETRYAQTVLQEVQRIDAIHDISRICGRGCDPVDDALGAYARALSTYEWDEGWIEENAEVMKVFDRLINAVATAEQTGAVPPHLRSALVTGQTELRRLRTDRHFILHADLAPHRWIVVLTLGLLTQIAMAALHIGRRPQLLLSLSTFSLAFAVVLAYTVALAWPTVDESIIPSNELARLLAQ